MASLTNSRSGSQGDAAGRRRLRASPAQAGTRSSEFLGRSSAYGHSSHEAYRTFHEFANQRAAQQSPKPRDDRSPSQNKESRIDFDGIFHESSDSPSISLPLRSSSNRQDADNQRGQKSSSSPKHQEIRQPSLPDATRTLSSNMDLLLENSELISSILLPSSPREGGARQENKRRPSTSSENVTYAPILNPPRDDLDDLEFPSEWPQDEPLEGPGLPSPQVHGTAFLTEPGKRRRPRRRRRPQSISVDDEAEAISLIKQGYNTHYVHGQTGLSEYRVKKLSKDLQLPVGSCSIPRKYTQQDRDEVIELFGQGKSVLEVSVARKIPLGTLHDWRRNARHRGLISRPAAAGTAAQQTSKADRSLVMQLYREGLDTIDIMQHVGLGKSTINQFIAAEKLRERADAGTTRHEQREKQRTVIEGSARNTSYRESLESAQGSPAKAQGNVQKAGMRAAKRTQQGGEPTPVFVKDGRAPKPGSRERQWAFSLFALGQPDEKICRVTKLHSAFITAWRSQYNEGFATSSASSL